MRFALTLAAIGAATALALLSAAATPTKGFGTYPWQLAISRAQKLRDSGQNDKAIPYMQRAYALARQLGKDHPFYSITLRHLSDTSFYDFKFDEARKFSLAELEILRTLGPDYQDTVPVLMRLSELDMYQGRQESAIKYLKEARQVRDKSTFNPLLKAEINARFSLIAMIDNNQVKYDEYRNKAQEEWIKAVKEPKTGSNFSEFGLEVAHMAEHADKNLRQALQKAGLDYAERGLSIIRRAVGPGTVAFVHATNRLAEIYRMQNRYPDALMCWRRAAAGAVASETMTDTEKTNVLYSYGKQLHQKGLYQDSIPFLKEAAKYAQSGYGPDLEADVLLHLSSAYANSGHTAEAIRLKRELVDRFDKLNMKAQAQSQRKEIDSLSTQSRF